MRRSAWRLGAVAAATCAWILAGTSGCERPSPSGDKAGQKTLLLYCGAGMRTAAAEVIDAFHKETGVTVQADYAGSGTLITRIKAGKTGDLYMPGEIWYVEELDRQTGLVDSVTPVTYFVPCLVVQKGNPHGVASLADLAKEGLKLGLGDARACQIGRVTEQLFEKNKLDKTAIEKNVVMTSVTVNELPLWVKTRSIDATIAWDAVVAQDEFADSVEMIRIPKDQNIISPVAVGVLKCSTDIELARKFAAFLAGPTGQAIFKKNHYRVTEPED